MLRLIALALIMLGFAAVAVPEPACAQGAGARSDYPPRHFRPRARIRVVPAYPYRLYSTDYPVPYEYEYPGPGAVRQCTSWLSPEHRPSGTVITPKMRCWWER